jgi:hypothetical protein
MFRASFESSPATALASLRESGCALLSAEGLRALVHAGGGELDALRDSWNRLPRDEHLRDGGHYRFRRHSCFVLARDDDHLEPVPHRAHYQSLDYNALHGGIERWFQPIEGSVIATAAWGKLVSGLGRAFFALSAARRWYVEAHPFRIDTAEGIGRPTPEGAHRDGVDFVAVVLIDRVAVKGGETRVFESQGAHGIRFTMREPWSALLLDDARVVHETSPVQPAGDAAAAHRDTLVLTFRAGGFQAPSPTRVD